MSYSYFAGTFRCLACGHEQHASITTKVESEPGTVFIAGSELPADAADMALSHFVVHEPQEPRSFFILETWDCPTCGSAEWIEASIENGIVRSLMVVPFDLRTFERANYVSEGIIHFYEEKTGEPFHVGNSARQGWSERLAEVLRNERQP